MIRMMTIAACFLAAACVFPLPASAQDDPPVDSPPHIQIFSPPAPSRPALLMPLYIGAVALQGYDGYSTLRGVREGSRETNSLVGGLADRPAAFWTVKAVTTAVEIYLTEQLWKQNHPKQAIIWMVVADGVMAVVAAHNASLVNSVH